MNRLRLLIVEDAEDDALLVHRELSKAGFDVALRRVEDADTLADALTSEWDIIISDWSLPSFDALSALAVVHAKAPDTPFIVVSGTVGEELAVTAMKAGAQDFLPKGRLARLVPAVERELKEAATRVLRRKVDAEHSDLRRALAALRASEERLRLLVGSARGIVFELDQSTRFVNVWTAAPELLFRPAEEIVGRTLLEALGDAHAPPFVELVKHVLASGQAEQIEYEMRVPAGNRWFLADVTPAPEDAAGARTVIIFVTDITARVESEFEIKRAKEAAEAANRTKSEFLANMSHELRTPLNAIIGFSELLVESAAGPLNEKQARYVENIHTSGQHLLTLINDVLDLSKVEAGKMVLSPSALRVLDVLRAAQSMVLPLATKKNVTLTLETGLDPRFTVTADESKLRQILYNLLSNAVKFTPEQGTITITARAGAHEGIAGDALLVSIADTGIGIAPEDHARIFLEFEQVDGSQSREYPGTGLGLALTKRLVLLHGGRIWVKSTPGMGATFTFALPIN